MSKKLKLVLGITTFNRCNFLKNCITSWNRTRDKQQEWWLVVADDGSTDGTLEFLEKIDIPEVHIKIIRNKRRGVHHQTNQILKYCESLDFDFGFKADDDVVFLAVGWDKLYINAIRQTGYENLILYDEIWGKSKRNLSFESIDDGSGLLTCRTTPLEVQGAFWTFTKRMIKQVGYFDVENFGLCGYGHTDYAWRCCRMGFNVLKNPFDAKGSEKFICLKVKGYKLSIPDEVRYKFNSPADIKRKKLILHENRTFIPYNETRITMGDESTKISSLSFIIPYRDREDQLSDLFLNLRKVYGNYDYEVIIVNQDDQKLFKRGQLCNLGYKKSTGDIVVFQDVDIRHFTPIDFEAELKRSKRGIVAFSHIAQITEPRTGVFETVKVEPRPEGFGACCFMTRGQFEESNGFSNLVIGWGAEDNLFNERCNLYRMKHTLGHVIHDHDLPHEVIKNSDWHKKNIFFWKTDRSRDPSKDSFRQTRSKTYREEKFVKFPEARMCHFGHICTTKEFEYSSYLEGRL